MQAEPRQARSVDAILAEMEQEAEATRRLFEIIPEDKLDWRPHPKAKSLGELAMHIATLQGSVAELGIADVREITDIPKNDPPAASREQIIQAFADSLAKAREIVNATDDDQVLREWQLKKDGQTVFSAPRMGFWRAVLLNHYYHHRGQLSTYLRQLDVPLPSVYGPTADTNPFG
jgi:uncharacterized damage-inducible protein DinB